MLVSHSSPNGLWCRRGIIQRVLRGRKILQHLKSHRPGGPLYAGSLQAESLSSQPSFIRTSLLPRRHHPGVRLPHRPIQLRCLLLQAGRQHHGSSRLPSRTGRCSSRALVEARRDRGAPGRHRRRHSRKCQGDIPSQYRRRERAEKLRGPTRFISSRILGRVLVLCSPERMSMVIILLAFSIIYPPHLLSI